MKEGLRMPRPVLVLVSVAKRAVESQTSRAGAPVHHRQRSRTSARMVGPVEACERAIRLDPDHVWALLN